ncbi:hypothetical protein M885DRAFT_60502 [Pelagophyceae sp. CCMP2097]|nr:hypothetical protein M885DRAFT_60502 [Pelagophyceae sp. CCMP2097]
MASSIGTCPGIDTPWGETHAGGWFRQFKVLRASSETLSDQQILAIFASKVEVSRPEDFQAADDAPPPPPAPAPDCDAAAREAWYSNVLDDVVDKMEGNFRAGNSRTARFVQEWMEMSQLHESGRQARAEKLLREFALITKMQAEMTKKFDQGILTSLLMPQCARSLRTRLPPQDTIATAPRGESQGTVKALVQRSTEDATEFGSRLRRAHASTNSTQPTLCYAYAGNRACRFNRACSFGGLCRHVHTTAEK